jgi:hypothetical protein
MGGVARPATYQAALAKERAHVRPNETQTLKSVMAKRAQKRYSIPMTELEQNILVRLIELDEAVKAMPTANPKPNLLPLFGQIEALADQLPRSTAPDLLHYMQRKSYEKARQWLEGRYAEIHKGGCRR